MDVSYLEKLIQFYFAKGIAPSTQRTYKAAQERYLRFCRDGNFDPLPLTQSILCAYISFLANDNLKHSTLKVYLSAARNLQISARLPDPFEGVAFPQLQHVMRGIKRAEAEKGGAVKQRFPITPVLLKNLWEVWSSKKEEHDTKMLWAACCLCFFAFLRAGEMTVPSDKDYDEAVHLSVSDISVDDPEHPSMLKIRIK